MSAKNGQRNPLLIWMATAVVAYALASGGVAVATLDECGEMSDHKRWVIAPPHWECGP